jgi:hypothetical protein
LIDRDVLFSVFDRKKGAIPIFYQGGITQEQASHIAHRSQMTLSMMDSAQLETAEAILPFSGLNKLGFILLFQIYQAEPAGEKCVASLSYLVPQDKQVFLYNKVPFLKFKAEELATFIKQNFMYSSNQSFPENLAKALTDWRVTEKEAVAEIQIVERKVTLSEKKYGGSIEFFLSQIKKNEDRALGALYRNRPVFVTGDSEIIIDLIVHSLDYFVPHASLRKVSYTTELIDPSQADIIGIRKDLAKSYPKETIIHVDKKQVKNGESCPYSKGIIKKIRKNPENTTEIIKNSTNELLKIAGMLIDVYSYPSEQREDKIKGIQKLFDSSIIEIAAEIGAERNPLIRELLLQQVSARFLDWMGDL